MIFLRTIKVPIRMFLASVWLLWMSRLAGLQIVKHRELISLAEAQQVSKMLAIQPRRAIVDRSRNVLAIDLPANDLYIHPALFKSTHEEVAKILSPIIGWPTSTLLQRFQESSTGIRLVDQLNAAQSLQIQRLWLDGLELLPHPERVYLQRGSLADVVGYVDMEQRGQAGIEFTFQNNLDSQQPKMACWMDGRGSFLERNFYEPILCQDTGVLQLTIDLNLQQAVAHLLHDALQRFHAKRICAIVMEVETGSIICLSTAPTYDPNLYERFPVERFRCWPCTDLFEPGSTFKPINMAIALETQSIATTDRIQDPGSMVVGTETIMNVEYDPNKSYQEKYLTPAEVLKYSSNVGMVRILQKLSPDKYYDWLTNLCDGSNLTADLPNVGTQSQLKSRSEFCNHPIEPAAASFGQGLSMTPLKLLQLTAAIGNGGYLVTPHVVSGILEGMGSLEKYLKPNLTRQDLQLLQEPPHSEDLYFGHIPIPAKALGWRLEQTIPPHARTRRRIFSPITTRAILQMLEEVILDGTGKRCFLPGYRVAGKTGTAQKASQHGGYLENAVVTSFIALYPVQNPKYATLVVIDEPEGPYGFASNTAADLTQAVISKIIFLNREPETYPRISLSERIYPNWISK